MKKKIASILSVIALCCCMILPAGAAEQLNEKNFREIYPAGSPELDAVVESVSNGAKVTLKKIDSRVTYCGETEEDEWGKMVSFDTITLKFENIDMGSKPTNVTTTKCLAISFSKAPGDFYADCTDGLQLRIFYEKDGVKAYLKKADTPDTGDGIFLDQTQIPGWDKLPESLTITAVKNGSNYQFKLNEFGFEVPADKIEQCISRSGKVFINIGAMGINNYTMSFVVNSIYNDPALKQTAPPVSSNTTNPSSTPNTNNNKPSSVPNNNNNSSRPDTTTDPGTSSDVSSTTTSGDISSTESTQQQTETQPLTMSGKQDVVKINKEKMTMSVKLGTTYEKLYEALTFTEGYDIAFYNPDGREVLDESGRLENGCGVTFFNIATGDEPAKFTVEVLDEESFNALQQTDAQQSEGGMPVWAIVVIIIAVVVVVGGGGFALYWFVIRKKIGMNQGSEE